MGKIIKYWKYRKQIIMLLRYSFAEVKDYRYLTKTEKKILRSEKEFVDVRSL
jgi:superfamily II RNA helicase